MTKYETIRELVKQKRDTIKDDLKFMRHENLTVQEKKNIELKELILKQSGTDLALIYENLVQMKHDNARLQLMPPEDPGLQTVQDRIKSYEEENEMLFNRLEKWLYPYSTYVSDEEMNDARTFLAQKIEAIAPSL